MRECSSVISVHRTPAGVKRGGRPPYGHGEGPVMGPLNCKTPCCYGSGRCFCWPCMKQIVAAHNRDQKGMACGV